MAVDTHQSASQSTDEPEKTLWLIRWLKDGMFWQGIVVQAVGSLFAALIILIIAVFAGVVSYTPAIQRLVLYIACTLIFFTIYTALFAALYALLTRRWQLRRIVKAIVLILIIICSSLSLITVYNFQY
jgi:hypothetical protein